MLVTALAVSLLAQLPTHAQVLEFKVDGVVRRATVFSPAVKSDHPPLVFGFHGHGGNMANAARSFQMHQNWPEAVTVYMQGLPTPGMLTDPDGKKPGWQSRKGTNGDRDLKFFDAVYARLVSDFHVGLDRVYAMGHSNGGSFTYLLWATRADKFAAFGPSGSVASVYRGQLAPKPAFIVSGEQDQLVRPIAQQRGISYVKDLNGAKGDVKFGVLKGEKADVGLYIYPGDHTYPQKANLPMVEFFKSHPRKSK